MAERLELDAVSKVFPNRAVALDEVSLEVPAGSFVVLLGPSGSGKTTLLRLVAGIERVSSGRIVIGERTVADGRSHVASERRGLSMVFQDYALWPHLSVLENVAFALRRHGVATRQRRVQAGDMLDRVGLGLLGDRYPGQLSGGEQQRVALARALVGGVGLILCDEPLSNLDADLRERMRLEIATLVREAGATAVYITHDQSEAFALADRIGVLEHGRLVQVSEPEDVYTHPAVLPGRPSPDPRRSSSCSASSTRDRLPPGRSRTSPPVRPSCSCVQPQCAFVESRALSATRSAGSAMSHSEGEATSWPSTCAVGIG